MQKRFWKIILILNLAVSYLRLLSLIFSLFAYFFIIFIFNIFHCIFIHFFFIFLFSRVLLAVKGSELSSDEQEGDNNNIKDTDKDKVRDELLGILEIMILFIPFLILK